MSTTEQSSNFMELVKNDPLSHPAPFSVRFFDFSLPPPPHLRDYYHSVWRAVNDEKAKTNIARFAPRNYGKTDSTVRVLPAWFAANFPQIRMAIVSHKAGIANDRAKQSVATIERVCKSLGIPIRSTGKTSIQLEAGAENTEATLTAETIRSDDTGSHYDVIFYDDIATFTNMTTARRDTISRKFEDYLDNVAAKNAATCLPQGSINVVIGTRKHEQDVYREHILKRNEHKWQGFCAPNEGRPDWEAKVYRATPDWHIVENGEYQIEGDDGELYDSFNDMPEEVNPINNGVVPQGDFRTLWPEFEPPESILFDIVAKGNSTAIWRTENQQNPAAASGQVLNLDWLSFVPRLPKEFDQYQWYAGLDFANPDNVEAKKRGSGSDYWALSVLAHDWENEMNYVHDVWRGKGFNWTEAANDFVQPKLTDYPVNKLLVESNFSGGEIAEVMKDELEADAGFEVVKSDSSGNDKEDRLYAMANTKFNRGEAKLVGDPEDKMWETFLQKEWLQFPDATHDDRMDSIEIALRGPEDGFKVFTSGDDGLTNLTFE